MLLKSLLGCTIAAILCTPAMFGGGPAVAATPVCQPTISQPSDAFPGQVTTANNFESGSLAPYPVVTSGTGTANVSSVIAYTGKCSAHLHVTQDSGSLAYFSVPLAAGTTATYTDAWFDITVAGVTGNDVPYFRFFSGNTRFVDVYRYNSNGQLWLRVLTPAGKFAYTRLRWQNIPLNTWHRVQMYVSPNGLGTTVKVWFDGTLTYSNDQVQTAATTVTRVQLGAEHERQMGDSYIDNLIVKSVLQ